MHIFIFVLILIFSVSIEADLTCFAFIFLKTLMSLLLNKWKNKPLTQFIIIILAKLNEICIEVPSGELNRAKLLERENM